jgi:predicted nucleic acid-binding protein
MTDRIFVDTNVWIYLFSTEDSSKSKAAGDFILANGRINTLVISFQVINEVSKVLLLKKKFSETDIRKVIKYLTDICMIQGNTVETTLLSSRLRERCSFSFWDSHIVASAVAAQCKELISEDMQDGFVVDGVVIRNIFNG